MTRDYVSINRAVWNEDAVNWVQWGEEAWQVDSPQWGNWGVPEATLSMLPADMTGMKAMELGCGTAYVSA